MAYIISYKTPINGNIFFGYIPTNETSELQEQLKNCRKYLREKYGDKHNQYRVCYQYIKRELNPMCINCRTSNCKGTFNKDYTGCIYRTWKYTIKNYCPIGITGRKKKEMSRYYLIIKDKYGNILYNHGFKTYEITCYYAFNNYNSKKYFWHLYKIHYKRNKSIYLELIETCQGGTE